MDKNRFRNISFCAIGALLALAFVQAWSLWRMYADRAEEFSRKVTLAMNRAAYDDLLMGNRRRTSQTRKIGRADPDVGRDDGQYRLR